MSRRRRARQRRTAVERAEGRERYLGELGDWIAARIGGDAARLRRMLLAASRANEAMLSAHRLHAQELRQNAKLQRQNAKLQREAR